MADFERLTGQLRLGCRHGDGRDGQKSGEDDGKTHADDECGVNVVGFVNRVELG